MEKIIHRWGWQQSTSQLCTHSSDDIILGRIEVHIAICCSRVQWPLTKMVLKHNLLLVNYHCSCYPSFCVHISVSQRMYLNWGAGLGSAAMQNSRLAWIAFRRLVSTWRNGPGLLAHFRCCGPKGQNNTEPQWELNWNANKPNDERQWLITRRLWWWWWVGDDVTWWKLCCFISLNLFDLFIGNCRHAKRQQFARHYASHSIGELRGGVVAVHCFLCQLLMEYTRIIDTSLLYQF